MVVAIEGYFVGGFLSGGARFLHVHFVHEITTVGKLRLDQILMIFRCNVHDLAAVESLG